MSITRTVLSEEAFLIRVSWSVPVDYFLVALSKFVLYCLPCLKNDEFSTICAQFLGVVIV